MLHFAERKELYRFLARLFAYPDTDLVASLEQGEGALLAGLVSVGGPPEVRGCGDLRELEVGYTDLFINRLGGAPTPPYGSVYLDPQATLMGESSQKVQAAYRDEGLSLDGGGEPPDFIATELEFLYYLVDREGAALARGDVAEAARLTASQKRFFAELFFPWVMEFCDRLAEETMGHPLYLWGGRLLGAFCHAEKEWLDKRD